MDHQRIMTPHNEVILRLWYAVLSACWCCDIQYTLDGDTIDISVLQRCDSSAVVLNLVMKVFVYFHPEKMHLLKILKQKIKLIHIEFFNCASGNAIIFWSGKYSCRWTMFIVYFRNMISPAGPLPKCSPANFYFYLFSRQKYFCDGEDFGFGNSLYFFFKKHTVIIKIITWYIV